MQIAKYIAYFLMAAALMLMFVIIVSIPNRFSNLPNGFALYAIPLAPLVYIAGFSIKEYSNQKNRSESETAKTVSNFGLYLALFFILCILVGMWVVWSITSNWNT